MTQRIKITPLGGVGEVGALNCMVYEIDEEAIIVDCGSQFPDDEAMGVDLIIPDFSYLRTIRHKLKGVVFTHGHEDHIGATPFLLKEFKLPIYGSRFTLGLIRNKIEEHTQVKHPKYNYFIPGESFHIGSFEIETIFVNHSIIEASAIIIHTPQGALVHLTDWKIDRTPVSGEMTNVKRFSEIGKKGVLAMFSDSTNIEQAGATLSEKEVMKQLKKICAKHPGRILITLFASNIQRVQELGKLAKSLGRKLALVGRSMHQNTELAREIGSMSFEGVEILDVEQTKDLKPHEVLVLVTGSQGEERSALSRMAFDQFKPFKLGEGDLVLFSSKIIPGNERNVFNVINHLYRRGVSVLYKSAVEIHTSGHAKRDELAEAIKRFKPKYFIPVHGEYRQLVKHSELAVETGVKKERAFVIENGQSLMAEAGEIFFGDVAPTGRVFVDGSGDVSSMIVRDRRALATTGIVVCTVMIDRSTGEIVREPEIILHGVLDEKENPDTVEKIKKEVLNTISSLNQEARTDLLQMQEEIRIAIRRFFRKLMDKKPVVIPVVLEV